MRSIVVLDNTHTLVSEPCFGSMGTRLEFLEFKTYLNGLFRITSKHIPEIIWFIILEQKRESTCSHFHATKCPPLFSQISIPLSLSLTLWLSLTALNMLSWALFFLSSLLILSATSRPLERSFTRDLLPHQMNIFRPSSRMNTWDWSRDLTSRATYRNDGTWSLIYMYSM